MKVSEDQYLINSWLFDFRYLYAEDRRYWSERQGARTRIFWHDDMIKRYDPVFRTWKPMFVDPEDSFNNVVRDAYIGWEFEQVLCQKK